MASVKIVTAMVVGTATPKLWCQVAVQETEQGKRIILLRLKYEGESDVLDLSSIGGDLLSSLKESESIGESTLEGLGEGISVEVLVVKTTGQEMELYGLGRVAAYLLREQKIAAIHAGSSKIERVVGRVEPQDKLIFATQETFSLWQVDELRQILSQGVVAVEEVAVAVHRQEDSAGMAAVMMEIEEVQEKMVVPKKINKWAEKLGENLRKIRIKRPLQLTQEKRKHNLVIGTILMALLVVGVIGGLIKRTTYLEESRYKSLESRVEAKIGEARSIGDLNPLRAKQLIDESTSEVQTYLEETNKEVYQNKAKELSLKIKNTEAEVFRKTPVVLTTLTTLEIVAQGLVTQRMIASPNSEILLPDQNSERVVVIGATDKSSYTIRTEGIGKIRDLASSGNKLFGVTANGIAEIAKDGSKIVVEPDDLWGEIVALDSFASNLYLLDLGQSEIWKYPALDSGFGARRRWLAPGITVDLSQVVDMSVDGDIWLVTSTGKLERYSRGAPVTLGLEGFPYIGGDKLVDPRAVVATRDNVYVLEAGAGRVVVIDSQTGKYLRQYTNDEFANASDMLVLDNRVYLLIEGKISFFGL